MSIVALELKSISGIPLHPLIVHIPVMLIPLAFVGAIAALAVPTWRSWCLPLTAVFATVSLFGVQLAIQSGEGLEEILNEESALIEKHAQLAEQARPMVFLFFLVAVLAAAAYIMITRDDGETPAPRTVTLRKALVPLCALSVLTGALATVWIYRTGHSGAESVWKESGSEGGGEKGEKSGSSGGDENQAPAPDGDTDGD